MSASRRAKKITDFTKKTSLSEEASKPAGESRVEIEELIKSRLQKSRIEEKSATSETTSAKLQEQVVYAKTAEPLNRETLEKLIQLAKEAASKIQVEFIDCDKQGNCSDGKRVGEIFEDSRGVKWQRGFLTTSRLPIFLNFLAEDSRIVGRVGKAFIVETSRGAKAIIPEDYICELSSRYGIILNVDKCTNYKTSTWSEKSGKSKKRS
ncbi:MAG: hypothetical protein LM556_02925 [Desulfurococcaceae archaeon]|nr:hypothetical protein [Desulfurococcaceae archaeon]